MVEVEGVEGGVGGVGVGEGGGVGFAVGSVRGRGWHFVRGLMGWVGTVKMVVCRYGNFVCTRVFHVVDSQDRLQNLKQIHPCRYPVNRLSRETPRALLDA